MFNASLLNSPLKAGQIMQWCSTTAPTGWLVCRGAAVSRTTYGRLFAAIGTTYGSGDGSTTFNLPNYDGVVPRGIGSQTISTRSKTGPTNIGDKQEDAIQGHYHSRTLGYSTIVTPNKTSFANNRYNATGGQPADFYVEESLQRVTQSVTVTAPSTDGSNGTPRTAAESRVSAIGCIWIIKV